MQSYALASGDHESGVRIYLTPESDDLSANQKELERAPGSPAPIRGYIPCEDHQITSAILVKYCHYNIFQEFNGCTVVATGLKELFSQITGNY